MKLNKEQSLKFLRKQKKQKLEQKKEQETKTLKRKVSFSDQVEVFNPQKKQKTEKASAGLSNVQKSKRVEKPRPIEPREDRKGAGRGGRGARRGGRGAGRGGKGRGRGK